jgi:hypothetical protein
MRATDDCVVSCIVWKQQAVYLSTVVVHLVYYKFLPKYQALEAGCVY